MTTRDTRNSATEDPAKIQAMFNAIAPTYDRLNHLLSFGLDLRWRKEAIRLAGEKRGGRFLDIAAGSGDLSIDALALSPQRVVAADFAVSMLHEFRRKLDARTDSPPVDLVACDAMHLPFADSSFDVTMVAFGIRNFADRLLSLKEMHRVLSPGGMTVILELSAPTAPVVAQGYALYTRVGLPLLGKVISRHNSAYSYLPSSIRKFPVAAEFLALMDEAGFAETRSRALTFGVATIYTGKKRA
jgi:demethylmenaquinone methyltransferase/2-methoxy-6-polyprenyl-1,4-benzoquinol methylase